MTITAGAPLVLWATPVLTSSVPSAQEVSLTAPVPVLIVIVPAALQFQFGEVLKFVFHWVASTFTEGGMPTLVQLTHAPPMQFAVEAQA
jgi:hypothetical protein